VSGEHVCGPPYPVKQTGRCCCCLTDCHEIRAVFTDGPLAGHPSRVGPQLDCGTQVEFLLSDGSEADVTFCFDCATRLQPAHYQALWQACGDRLELSLRGQGRRPQEITMARAAWDAHWPVAVLRCRKELPDLGRHGVDRRWQRAGSV